MEVPVGHDSFELRVHLIVSEIEPEVVGNEVVDVLPEVAILSFHEFDVAVSLPLFPVVRLVDEDPLSDSISVVDVLGQIVLVVVVGVKVLVVISGEVVASLGHEHSQGSISGETQVFLDGRRVDRESENTMPCFLGQLAIEFGPTRDRVLSNSRVLLVFLRNHIGSIRFIVVFFAIDHSNIGLVRQVEVGFRGLR